MTIHLRSSSPHWNAVGRTRRFAPSHAQTIRENPRDLLPPPERILLKVEPEGSAAKISYNCKPDEAVGVAAHLRISE